MKDANYYINRIMEDCNCSEATAREIYQAMVCFSDIILSDCMALTAENL